MITLLADAKQLVLLPGLDGTGRLFANLRAEFPPNVRAFVVTYPADRFLSYPDLIPVVEQMLPRNGPFFLVAESFSTPLAVEIAATHPANLAGFIICAGFITNPVPGFGWLARIIARPWVFSGTPPGLLIGYFLIGKGADRRIEHDLRAALRLVSPSVIGDRIRAVIACDVTHAFSRIRAPIMFIQPQFDRLVASNACQQMRNLQPEMEIVRIAAPHLALQVDPREAARAITEFIGRVSPP